MLLEKGQIPKPQISPLRYAPVEMTNLLQGSVYSCRKLQSIA
jgi:hypothetical protein